ncbi:hypothetical protein D3C71_1950690 [compost metagenome]
MFSRISGREKDDLFRLTVDIHSYSKGDYYGGSVKKAKFICDIERLFELFDEKGYIDENYYLEE